MTKLSEVSVERIRELLDYDPETGKFIWRTFRRGGCEIGDEATGYITPQGYRRINVNGTRIFAHRLAWILSYNEYPAKQIDHVNGDKLDNRLINLRLATSSQNKANGGRYSNNTSGYKGVSFDKQYQRWSANIGVGMKLIKLGRFATAEEAHLAYQSAAVQYFGEFARFE